MNFSARYDGVLRREAPAELKLEIVPKPGQAISVALSRSFTDQCKIDAISPQPTKLSGSADTIQLQFEASDPFEANLRYTPERWGELSFTVQIANGDSIEIRQWVLP